MRPTISIVIVNWNTRDDLLACITSVRDNPPSAPYEVLVVDNASSDESVRAVREREPAVSVLANTTNRGLAAANNQGMTASRGDIIVISNPDVLFQEHSIDHMVAAMGRHPRAAFVFSRLHDADGSIQTSAGALPTLRQAIIGHGRTRQVVGEPPFLDMWWNGWAHDREIPIGHGGESCYAVRASALDDIGLQDPRYTLDWEGIDWCARAWKAGWEVWFCPEARVVHLGARSLRKARFRWVLESHRGMLRYFAERSSRAWRPVLALLVAFRAALKLVALAAGRGSSSTYLDS